MNSQHLLADPSISNTGSAPRARVASCAIPRSERASVTTTVRPNEQAGPPSEIAVPRPPLAARARTWLLWLGIAGLLAWSWGPTEMHKVSMLITDWRNMAEFGAGFMR